MAAEPPVHGWVILDKPLGMTSSRVVERVRRAAGIKAGHAGTLDPLATGVLPIALGEATKTVRFLSKATKTLQLQHPLGRGDATPTTARAKSSPRARCARSGTRSRPRCRASPARSRSAPPAYSAIKVAGRARL